MDASVSSSRGAAGDVPTRRPWYLSRFGIAVTLGALLGVANLIILRGAVVLYPHFGVAYQLSLTTFLILVQQVVFPLTLLLVALVVALRSHAATRISALACLGFAMLVLIILAVTEPFVLDAITHLPLSQYPGIVSLYDPFPWAILLPYVWQGLAFGLMLIILLRVLTPSLAPHQFASRVSFSALNGVIAGAVFAFYQTVIQLVDDVVLEVQSAHLAAVNCAKAADIRCPQTQLELLGKDFTLPLVVGTVLGAVMGALLLSLRPAPPNDVPSLAPQRVPAQRRRTGMLVLAACLLVGILYGLLSRLVLSNIRNLGVPIDVLDYTVPVLAFVLPVALVVLVVAPRSRAATSPTIPRAFLLSIAIFGLLLGLALAVSVAIWPSMAVIEPEAAAVLAAFSLSAALSPVAMHLDAAPTWRTGLRAAAFGWLGYILVVLVILGQILFTYITPPNPTSYTDLLGEIYLSYFSFGSVLIFFGLPVAFLTGGLIGVLGARLRASTAPVSAPTV